MSFTKLRKLSMFSNFCFKIHKNSAVLGILGFRNCNLIRHSSNIIQMRGLDYDTTEQDVIDFFKPLGLMPKKVHLKCDGGGRTASVSEVEFNTHSEAVVAMRKRNAFMGNRFIRLTLKSSEPIDPVNKQDTQLTKAEFNVDPKIKESVTPGGHYLRMKNVPRRATDQAIYEFFWPVGAYPISVKALYNESELRNGEFDVQFLSHEDVKKALAKNNCYFGNKYVELSLKQN